MGMSVIVYIMGDTPTIASMTRFVEREWNFVSKSQIFLHDKGYFIVKFVSKVDRDEVLFAGPYTFFGIPMVVEKWEVDFNFQQQALKVVLLWVRFPNLPLNCKEVGTLSRLGSLLGVPLYVDECTTQQLRVPFARILVEVDATKSLLQEIVVEDPSGRTFTHKVTYDWALEFCQQYYQMGMIAQSWGKRSLRRKKDVNKMSEEIPDSC
ncbi:Hydroxycarboxylate dehydrogenase A [Bienertia sinuspersici]